VSAQVVRYTVPSFLPCYGDWDFRIHPGTFDFLLAPLLAQLQGFVAEQRQSYRRYRKKGDGYRSYIEHIAAVDWLKEVARSQSVILWDSSQEDVIWWPAGPLVYGGQFAQVVCPACALVFSPQDGRIQEWHYGSGLAASWGRRYVCPVGHTLFAIGDGNS
jgi:hypothetical protein